MLRWWGVGLYIADAEGGHRELDGDEDNGRRKSDKERKWEGRMKRGQGGEWMR